MNSMRASTKRLKYKKKNQAELKNRLTEMKNTIKGTNSTKDYAEEWISDMEDKTVKITQLEQQREKKKML